MTKKCNFCGQEYKDFAEHRNCSAYIKYRNEKRKIRSRKLRQTILERDKKCVMCGSTNNLQIDHIKPVMEGGLSEEKNLFALCPLCKSINGVKTFLRHHQWPDEYIETIIDTLRSKESGLKIASVTGEKERVIVKFLEQRTYFIFKKDGYVEVRYA